MYLSLSKFQILSRTIFLRQDPPLSLPTPVEPLLASVGPLLPSQSLVLLSLGLTSPKKFLLNMGQFQFSWFVDQCLVILLLDLSKPRRFSWLSLILCKNERLFLQSIRVYWCNFKMQSLDHKVHVGSTSSIMESNIYCYFPSFVSDYFHQV